MAKQEADLTDLTVLTDDELQAIINDGDARILVVRAEMRAAVTVLRDRASASQFQARIADLSDDDRRRLAQEMKLTSAATAAGVGG